MAVSKTYYADFETTTPNEKNQVRVYLWVMLAGPKVDVGYDIESFVDKLSTMKKSVIYFHNLKFDFSYIHYYCLKNNIECKVLEKKGTIYQVKIYNVQLRDSMNFMPMTLKEVGDNYCTKYQKTSIDYNVDWDHQATEEEIEYCINDCRVLEEGLTNYLGTLYEVLNQAGSETARDKVTKKLTNAGIAFEAFKEFSTYDECCPKTTNSQYRAFRDAYKGGYVYSNPKGVCDNVQMIDCNSMYPFIYSTLDMPYGHPLLSTDMTKIFKFNFYIVRVLIKYDLRPGYIPIIGGGVGKFGSTFYKSSSNGEYEEHTYCNIDLDLIKRFYDCDIQYIWGAGFDTKPYFFKRYCDIFLKVKNESKGIKRAVAKVMLNSPYGKTAMNGLTEIKRYYIDDDHHQVKSEVIGYEVDDSVFQYLPIAIQITAGARRLLLNTAEKIGFENVYYMDTDSIKFQAKETGIHYDDNVLGDWKDEGYCELFKTISPKKYVYWSNGVIKYTCAGFSKKVLSEEMRHNQKVSREEAIKLMNRFDKGLFLTCLQSKVVEGGRALLPSKKEIK